MNRFKYAGDVAYYKSQPERQAGVCRFSYYPEGVSSGRSPYWLEVTADALSWFSCPEEGPVDAWLTIPLASLDSGDIGLRHILDRSFKLPTYTQASHASNGDGCRGGYCSCFDGFWGSPKARNNWCGHDGQMKRGKALLDLLYDLRHSTDDRMIGLRRELSGTLLQAPLIAAISKKAEYYFQRKRYLVAETQEHEPLKKKAAESLEISEREWLSVLLPCLKGDPDIFKSVWLRTVEQEMRRTIFWDPYVYVHPKVCVPKNRGNWSRVWVRILELNRQRQRHLGDSTSFCLVEKAQSVGTWFLRRYDLDAAGLMAGMAASTLLRNKVCQWVEDLKVFHWFKKKNPKLTLERVSIATHVVIWKILLPILALLPSLMIARALHPWQSVKWIAALHQALPYLVAMFVLLSVAGVWWWQQRKESSVVNPMPWHPLRRLILFGLLFGIQYLCIADLGGLENEWFKKATILMFDSAVVMGVLGLVLLAFLLPLLGAKEGGISSLAFLVVRISLPRLIFATTGAWILIVTTEEIVKASYLAHFSQFVTGALLLVVALIFCTIEVYNGSGNLKTAAKRALTILCMGYFISVVVGACTMGLLMKPFLCNSGVLNNSTNLVQTVLAHNISIPTDLEPQTLEPLEAPEYRDPVGWSLLEWASWGAEAAPFSPASEKKWEGHRGIRLMYEFPVFAHKKFYVFPGMLLYRACLALFAGLFLQLIAEDKAITEPL